MPWNDNAGGGGPWGSGGGRDDNPWRRGPGSGRPGGPGGQQPDLDELIRGLQARLNRLFGGGGGGKGKGTGAGSFGFAVVFGGAALLWIVLTGVYQVGANEAGVVTRFGEYVRTTAPGLNLKLPFPIEQVEKPEVTDTQTTEIGSNQRGVLMLTRDENIVDLGFTVQWKVDERYPEGVRDFLFNVRDVDDTIRAVAESAMREVVGTTDLEPIITGGRVEVSLRTRDLMQSSLDEYAAGVQVLQVNLQRAQAPEAVIDAFRDVDAAAQDAERVRLNATAYLNSVVPQARGVAARELQRAQAYRDSVIAEAQGQADRFVAILNEYEAAPEVTRRRMYLETMENVLGRSELIILDQQGTGAIPYLPLDRLGQNRGPAPQNDQSRSEG